jgi:hypothetical protein
MGINDIIYDIIAFYIEHDVISHITHDITMMYVISCIYYIM